MRKKQKLVSMENSEMELWLPHENKLLIQLRSQKANGKLCDVVFIHEDFKIYSHACVLASFSPYMMELLFENKFLRRDNWSIKTPLKITLTDILKQHELICCDCFKSIIDYMYTSKIYIPKSEYHLKHVEYTARLLQIDELIQFCTQYSVSENKATNLNHIDTNKCSVKDSEILPNGVDNVTTNGENFGNIYNLVHQKEMPTRSHSEEKVQTNFFSKTTMSKNMDLKLSQNSDKKIKKMILKKHDRFTCKPHSNSESSKLAFDVVEIKTNQDRSFEGKSKTILCTNVCDNNQTNQDDANGNITDMCLSITGQKAECRPSGNAKVRTDVKRESLCKEICNDSLLGCECDNKFITLTTDMTIPVNSDACNRTEKLYENKKTGKYNTLVNSKHNLFLNNCIQSNSICETSSIISESDANTSTSCNKFKEIEYNETIGNNIINIGNTNNSYTCDICQYKTKDLYLIVEHLEKNDHNQTHCSVCTCRFRDNKEFKSHLKVHKEKFPFLCLKCNRKFIKVSNFRKHLLSHINEKPLICSICNATFKLPHSFSRHMINKHNKSKGRIYPCEHCSYSTLKKSDLIAHLNNLHRIPLSMFKCSVPNCEFKTARKVNLILHNKKTHLKVCDESKTAFADRKSLNQKVSENCTLDSFKTTESLPPASNIVQIKCNVCNYRTPKEHLYRKHVRKWHSQNEKTRLNNPIYNTRNSAANNSLQFMEKNYTKVYENNSSKQNFVQKDLLISKTNSRIDNKLTSNSHHQSTHNDKNLKCNGESSLLPICNNGQIQNINTEQELMLPIDNTQKTDVTSTAVSVLLWNIYDDHGTMHCLVPKPIQTATDEQLCSDNFQFNSTDINNSSSTQQLSLTSTEGEGIFNFIVDSFSNESLSNTSDNPIDNNNNGCFIWSGIKDVCMSDGSLNRSQMDLSVPETTSDGSLNMSQMDLSVPEITDNTEVKEFLSEYLIL